MRSNQEYDLFKLAFTWIVNVGLGIGFVGILPIAESRSQQLQPLGPPKSNPAESAAESFLIQDPKQAASVTTTNHFTGNQREVHEPAQANSLISSSLIAPDWTGDKLEELGVAEELSEKGDFVQAVFTLPGPPRSPNAPALPYPGAARTASDSAEEPLDSQLLDVGTEPAGSSLLDTLKVEDFFQVAAEPYRYYRSSEARLTYLAASSGSFGWTSMEWEPYLKREQSSGLTGSIQHHFLSGPRDVDLPPRLHDFILGYQRRGRIGEYFSFDCAASVGIFSDFRGSAREGVRFPAHAVGMIHASHRADWVLGVDYLDRDDYKILPVVGISWHDLNWTSLRYDLIFPRPRIDFTLDDGQRVYLAGNLGGGTWDVEYPDGSGGVMNYRDFRVMLGREQRYMDGSRQSIEIGYVFGRELTLRGVPGETDFRNAVMIRLLSRY